MTKDITPMKRYTFQMQELNSQLKSFLSRKTLNKSEPKNYYSNHESLYTKGVQNDFIVIFSENLTGVSFALAFNYIGLAVSEQTVKATVKISPYDGGIKSSEEMTLDEFKNKLTFFNKWLAENNVKHCKSNDSSLLIIDKFSDIFTNKQLNIKKEVERNQKKLNEIILEKEKDLNILSLAQKLSASKEDLKKANSLILNNIENSPEFKELKKIEKRAAELIGIVNANRNSLEKDMKVLDLSNNVDVCSLNLNLANISLAELVKEELSKVVVKKPKLKR